MPEMLSVPVAPKAPAGPPDHAHAPAAGRDTQGPPFKDVLKDHQARTADAEGHHKPVDGDSSKGKPSCTDKDATTPEGEATDPTATPQAAVGQALALTLVAPAAPVTPAVAAPPAAEAAAPQAGGPTTAALAAVAETAAGVPADVTGEATATGATTVTDAPAGGVPVTALPAGAARTDGKPAADVANALTPAAAPAPEAQGQAAAAAPVAPGAATAAATAPVAEKAAAIKADQPAAAPAQPAPAQAPVHNGSAPVQAPHAPAPTASASPLNTAQAVERIQAMVHLAHSRGTAQARIELHPAELGGVTIQLHVAHDGLRAHIAADRPEALPLLQRAASDLQRSLESRGIDLSGLDFGLAPDAEAGASRDDGRAQQRQGAFGGPGRLGSDEETDVLDAASTTTRSVELPAGALVDVRA